ncbi:hypothetical protein D3C76_1673410 [compost metagenome]
MSRFSSVNGSQQERYCSHQRRPNAEVIVKPMAELDEVTLAQIAVPGGTMMLPVKFCVKAPGAN